MTASGTLLLWTAAFGAVVASAAGAGACRSYVAHPIDCDNALRLRLGQSPNEVRRLLGVPAFAAPQQKTFSNGTRVDTMWSYGTFDSVIRQLVPHMDDRVNVEFFQDQVVRVNAYQVLRVWDGRGGPREALSLEYSYAGPDRQEIREIGPAFESVFTCAPAFSRGAIPTRENRPIPEASTVP